MWKKFCLPVLALAAVLLSLRGFADPPVKVDNPPSDAEQEKFFVKEVRPILQSHCVRCHGDEARPKGKLRLTTRAGLAKGGKHGSALNIDQPEKSLLLHAIGYQDETRKMPPAGKLPKAQIDILTKWVKMGAPWPEKLVLKAPHGPPKVDDDAKNFWAFKQVVRPEVPEVKNRDWVKTPIDAFIVAKLEEAGFKPAPPADKAALVRRLYYDVIGLPPTPAEVEAFVADKSADAYAKVVDRLLASPHYGEHWARHWMDVVRYAESNSFERDSAKPFIWRYRDYLIRSFNDDKPYDQFIREQLAGDELDEVTPDSLIATGYYRLGIWDDEAPDKLLAYYDDLDDIISTTGQAFLGLTIGCARCHDHKIDPFPQKDYYGFLAFFHGVNRYNGPGDLRNVSPPELQKKHQAELAALKEKVAGVEKRLLAIENVVRPHLKGGERDDFQHEANRLRLLRNHVPDHISDECVQLYVRLRKQRDELNKTQPAGMIQATCVSESAKARDTFVLTRGNPQAKGDKVEPGFPSVLTDAKPVLPESGPSKRTTGRRRVLADWIADAKNPLTARVMVNRVWQYHFGRGIVRSSSNFGYMGTAPTHPELLDWLASEFVKGGMKLKPLHKLILMSSAYQMSSQAEPKALAKDPENDLFWRFNMRRLSAEELRDSILAASGNLNAKKIGGASVFPFIPKEVLAGQSMPGLGWVKSSPEEMTRRSVYVHIKRSLALPILSVFDAPDPDSPCPVRFTTTQPTQALGMINGEFLNEQAKVFAANVRKDAGEETTKQVRLALQRATQRTPTKAEIDRGLRFLATMRDRFELGEDEALRRFCLLCLNLNEFVFVD